MSCIDFLHVAASSLNSIYSSCYPFYNLLRSYILIWRTWYFVPVRGINLLYIFLLRCIQAVPLHGCESVISPSVLLLARYPPSLPPSPLAAS